MLLRVDIEKREYELSPRASRSAESKGRRWPENSCEFRTEYQRDRDRIIHSKTFRRLMHKTQVFLAPEGDHYRTRLTHTLEVSQVSRTVCRALNLNEDLTEAIALGHDLGHTPFGHNGEELLNEIHPGRFRHNEQSLRVVEVLENSGDRSGMNLTYEVRDGILNHSGSGFPTTLEGEIVRLCDRIAYINHDIDDAIRSGVIKADDLPADSIAILGNTHKMRIDTLVKDMIQCSSNQPTARLSEEKWNAMNELRKFMFANVYSNQYVKNAADQRKVETIITSLFEYYLDHPDELPEELKSMTDEYPVEELVKDHVAGMTDRYAINKYNELFVPVGWK